MQLHLKWPQCGAVELEKPALKKKKKTYDKTTQTIHWKYIVVLNCFVKKKKNFDHISISNDFSHTAEVELWVTLLYEELKIKNKTQKPLQKFKPATFGGFKIQL